MEKIFYLAHSKRINYFLIFEIFFLLLHCSHIPIGKFPIIFQKQELTTLLIFQHTSPTHYTL